ncbi:MAG: LysR substrate-binding domain-containing protein [Pseudomonadota bacterium]
MPTIKQLRYFDAVARQGHFGQAALSCSVSQPALSMQIQDLEAELGVVLLERLSTGARLTEAGQDVARRAAEILVDLRDLGDAARQHRAPLSGPLSLGVIPSVAPYMLPPLLPRVRRDFADLELRIRESQTEHILAELRDGTLDALLLALPIEGREIEVLPLFDDPFVLATPAGHPLSHHVRVDPDLIGRERILLLEEGHCFREQALSFCQLRQVGDIDTFGASTLATVVQMVANGMGVTLLPEMAIPVEGRNPAIALHRFEAPEPHREIGLVWRRTSPRRSDFEALGAMIRSARDEGISALLAPS